MTVFLVGAGPGDPGLLTVRGRELLETADAVLYDGLIDPRILDYTPAGCELVDVAKVSRRLGHDGLGEPVRAQRTHYPSQDRINALLVDYGQRYGCVVRLKGGDPFVFGRGGEEALALAEAGVPFEVVPGVSSAIAAPAYAGIPVTHRGLAASVAIVTGHEAPEKPAGQAAVDWSRLATAVDTLVILMGVGHLPAIARDLVAHGRDPETPAAIVERGTTAEQRVVTGPLCDLPALAAEAGVRSPAAVVVGNVVALAERLAWYAPAEASAEVPGCA